MLTLVLQMNLAIISVNFLDVKYISLPHKKRFFKFDEYKP